jgi:hypothetical protein
MAQRKVRPDQTSTIHPSPDSPVSLWSGRRHRLLAAAPYLLLLVFTLLFFRDILFTSDGFIPFDLPFYHLPQAVFASRSFSEGQLPRWDPSTS